MVDDGSTELEIVIFKASDENVGLAECGTAESDEGVVSYS